MSREVALCPVLVCREEELSVLEDALLSAAHGEGRTAVISGDAGMGKTRLAAELLRRARRLRCTVMWGSCSGADLALPHLPFLEAIGNHLARSEASRIRTKLGPACRDLGRVFPQFETKAAHAEDVDAGESKARFFEAVVGLLAVVSADSPLLLVIEDLHWADTATRELVDYVARRVTPHRIMLLTTSRTEGSHRRHPLQPLLTAWRRDRLVEWISLSPLPPVGIGEMVSAILAERISGEFETFLHGRSEGNPYVLEEILKGAMDRRDLYRVPGGWQRRAISEISVPQSVADSVLLRADSLSKRELRVLQAAAVLGESFDHLTLADLIGLPLRTVDEAVTRCVQQQLLEIDPAASGRSRFRHELTRDAVYQDLLPPTRQHLHARAAAVMGAQSTTAPVDVAHHLLAAGRGDEAIPYCLDAASEALRRYAPREAAQLYDRCLPLIANRTLRGQVLCHMGESLRLSDDPKEALAPLEEGVALLEQVGETLEAARHRLNLGRCHWERDRPDLARSEFERARHVLEEAGPSADLAHAYIRLAGLHVIDYEGREGQLLSERAVDVATRADADSARIWAYTYLGSSMCLQGDVDQGLEYLDRSYREASEHGLHWIAYTALINGIHERFANARPREAATLLERLRSTQVGTIRHAMLRMFEAYLHRASGELLQAHACAAEYFVLSHEKGQLRYEASARLLLAGILADMARGDEARSLLPADVSDREDMVEWWAVRMRLHLVEGDHTAAASVAREVHDVHGWDLPCWLPEQAVEALIAAGDLDRAAEMIQRGGRSFESVACGAFRARARGRLALARHDASGALAELRSAADLLATAGESLELARTLILLSGAHAAQGDLRGAQTALQHAVDIAVKGGAQLHVTAALARADELGLSLQVRTAYSGPAGDAAMGPQQPSIETAERLVTVLFLDVRGYTPLSTVLPPADMAERIATFYRWAEREVERHHGIIDKFSGDAVMATFNVRRSRLDHCVAALETAIALRDRMTLLELPVGAGIAVGSAVVGQVGSTQDFAVLGEATNMAARLQAQAGPGEVLLTDEAYRRAGAWLDERAFVVESVQLNLKGFSRSVTAHRVTGGG